MVALSRSLALSLSRSLALSLFVSFLACATDSHAANSVDLSLAGVNVIHEGGSTYKIQPTDALSVLDGDGTSIGWSIKIEVDGVTVGTLSRTFDPGGTIIGGSTLSCYNMQNCPNDCVAIPPFWVGCVCRCKYYNNTGVSDSVMITEAVTITVTVDSTGAVSESSETNNVFSVNFAP